MSGRAKGTCFSFRGTERVPLAQPRKVISVYCFYAYDVDMIAESRLRQLNDHPIIPDGHYVLYWMQASQRTRYNHALEYAIDQANTANRPLLVGFGLMDDYPEANARHYMFMLEGLRDVEIALKHRGILFVVRRGNPGTVAVGLARQAALVVCDRGYLRHQRAWRDHVADHANCRVMEVESDVIVPVEEASIKQEFGARTIRPRLHRKWPTYLVELKERKVKHPSLRLRIAGDIAVSSPEKALAGLKVDRSIPVSSYFTGGQIAAQAKLTDFIDHKLSGYDEERNEPAKGHTSTLAAYLHFGQISALEMVLAVQAVPKIPTRDRDAFVEELAVRRELAMNFVYYCPNYDRYDCLPAWAKKTLSEHRLDKRSPVYDVKQLEAAETYDPYWNAAQREMNVTGFMHNYMRMYWGKKVLEWGRSPEESYDMLLHLNNKLFLCGRDANSFASVAWIFGLHDRAWGPVRPVFGKIRYMNAAGLKRKFDIEAYVKKVALL